jgi:hypothetical protein
MYMEIENFEVECLARRNMKVEVSTRVAKNVQR